MVLEERTGWGLRSFLAHLALGVVPVPGLERVTLVGVDKNVRVNFMHPLFFVRFDVYSTVCPLFAFLGELTAKGLLLVMEIPPDFFVTRHSVCAVPRSYNTAHLGGISLLDWQTKPCKNSREETRQLGLQGNGVISL